MAQRGQTGIGIVLPEQQTVFGTAGHHTVGIAAPLGDQVIDEGADIGLGPCQDDALLPQGLPGRH